MAKIWKEKERIYFESEKIKRKTYYDINKGHFVVNRVKNLPSEVPPNILHCIRKVKEENEEITPLTEFLYYKILRKADFKNKQDTIRLFDKYCSIIEACLDREEIIENSFDLLQVFSLYFNLENFLKTTSAIFKKYPSGFSYSQICDEYCIFQNKQYATKIIPILKNWNLSEKYFINLNLTPSRVDIIIECPMILYYFVHGARNFYEEEEYENCAVIDTIHEKILKAEECQMSLPKTDYFHFVCNLNKFYTQWQNKYANQMLQETYTDKYNYETDEYIAYMPKTTEEYLKEGNNQSNCVYSEYLGLVCKGKTHIIFIRKKSNVNRSWVTCEVSLEDEIEQYLMKFNNNPDEEAEAFKIEYQNFLNSLGG